MFKVWIVVLAISMAVVYCYRGALAEWSTVTCMLLLGAALLASIFARTGWPWRSSGLRACGGLAAVALVVLTIFLLRSPAGTPVWSEYQNARLMAAELQEVARGGSRAEYLAWHTKWSGRRSQLESWFPGFEHPVERDENKWAGQFTRRISKPKSTTQADLEAVLEKIDQSDDVLRDTDVHVILVHMLRKKRQEFVNELAIQQLEKSTRKQIDEGQFEEALAAVIAMSRRRPGFTTEQTLRLSQLMDKHTFLVKLAALANR